MGETADTIIRYLLIGGLVVAIWNFNNTMERIADALTRIADRNDSVDDRGESPV